MIRETEYTFGEALLLIEEDITLKLRSDTGQILEYNKDMQAYTVGGEKEISLTDQINRYWYKEPIYLSFMEAVEVGAFIKYSGDFHKELIGDEGLFLELDVFCGILHDNLFPEQIRDVLLDPKFETSEE